MFSGQYLFRAAGGKIVLAAVAALLASASEPTPVFARAASPASQHAVVKASSDVSDVGARRRYRRVHRGNPAAGLAIMGAMIGTFGAIAAHQHDDDYYDEPGYYPGPGYY